MFWKFLEASLSSTAPSDASQCWGHIVNSTAKLLPEGVAMVRFDARMHAATGMQARWQQQQHCVMLAVFHDALVLLLRVSRPQQQYSRHSYPVRRYMAVWLIQGSSACSMPHPYRLAWQLHNAASIPTCLTCCCAAPSYYIQPALLGLVAGCNQLISVDVCLMSLCRLCSSRHMCWHQGSTHPRSRCSDSLLTSCTLKYRCVVLGGLIAFLSILDDRAHFLRWYKEPVEGHGHMHKNA